MWTVFSFSSAGLRTEPATATVKGETTLEAVAGGIRPSHLLSPRSITRPRHDDDLGAGTTATPAHLRGHRHKAVAAHRDEKKRPVRYMHTLVDIQRHRRLQMLITAMIAWVDTTCYTEEATCYRTYSHSQASANRVARIYQASHCCYRHLLLYGIRRALNV